MHISRLMSLCLLWGWMGLSAHGRVLQYIPPGSFAMGDASFGEVGEGMADERPVHMVALDGFYLEDREVTAELWEWVRSWATTNGYSDLAVLSTANPECPAVGISWYDAVKWCNARSEMTGLPPVYVLEAGHTEVYRTGTVDLVSANVASGMPHAGYRLPTEAEWERAARGGVEDTLFPWAASTNGSYRNHISADQAAYDASLPSTVASFPANGFGLYDMAGNASEWCWDVYDADGYARFPADVWPPNPRGPDTIPLTLLRVSRGGSWISTAFDLRCAFRDAAPPAETNLVQGFRCARDFAGNEDIDRDSDGLPDWWTQQHFGHPTGLESDKSRATDDATGCGMSNLQKYLAGLDPTDPESVLRLAQVGAESRGNVIRWTSVSNRTYDVQWVTNLSKEFTVLETNLPSSPPVNVYTDRVHTTVPVIFYRIGVKP